MATHRFLLAACFTSHLFLWAHSSVLNKTVDDSDISLVYSPANAWKTQQGASSSEQPSPQVVYNHTWHEGIKISNGTPVNMTFTFAGSGIYLYGILPTCDPNFYGNYSFVLDDGPKHTFEHDQTLDSELQVQAGVAKFQYNVLLFSNKTIPYGNHTLIAVLGEGKQNVLVQMYIDYIVINSTCGGACVSGIAGSSSSLESGAFTTSQASAPSNSSGSGITSASGSETSSHRPAIIGGIVAGIVAAILLALLSLLCIRRHRSRGQSQVSRDIAPSRMIDTGTSLGRPSAAGFAVLPEDGVTKMAHMPAGDMRQLSMQKHAATDHRVESVIPPNAPRDMAPRRLQSPMMTHVPEDVAGFKQSLQKYTEESQLVAFYPESSTFLNEVAQNAYALKEQNDPLLQNPVNVDHLIRLALHQLVLYCDDSSSMAGAKYAIQQQLVSHITRLVTNVLPSGFGIELHFINADSHYNLTAHQVDFRVDEVTPRGDTMIGTNLRSKILQPLVYNNLRNAMNRLERPLLIFCVTDGCPTSESVQTFRDAIIECRTRVVNAGYVGKTVMFSINQVGGDEDGFHFLRDLSYDCEIQDVLYCTSDQLDDKFREFKENKLKLDEWLLTVLAAPLKTETP